MSKGFTIELEGLQETLNRLQKIGDETAKAVDDEIAAGVRDMERSAKRLCPVDTGRLRASISASRNAFLNWELVAQADYAAYVEFGTGRLVDIPAGLEDYAIQFKGKGLRQVNLPARPYFFPSVYAYWPKIKENIVKVIREERK
jgi:hypothetical protein